MDESKARLHVAKWIAVERVRYADVKYAPDSENFEHRLQDIKDNGIGPDSTEMVFLTNYLKRAELMGVDTPAGRQQFGKFVVTATAMLERIVLAFGEMPKPAVPSGQVEEWPGFGWEGPGGYARTET